MNITLADTPSTEQPERKWIVWYGQLANTVNSMETHNLSDQIH